MFHAISAIIMMFCVTIVVWLVVCVRSLNHILLSVIISKLHKEGCDQLLIILHVSGYLSLCRDFLHRPLTKLL